MQILDISLFTVTVIKVKEFIFYVFLKKHQPLTQLSDWLLSILINGQVKVKGYYREEENISMAVEDEVVYETNIR